MSIPQISRQFFHYIVSKSTMRTIDEGSVDGPTLAITIKFGEQPKPYKSQNQAYIDMMEEEYRTAPPVKKPLIRKAVEYLETHAVTASHDEALYAAQEYGVGEIKAGIIDTSVYHRIYCLPKGMRQHNAYAMVRFLATNLVSGADSCSACSIDKQQQAQLHVTQNADS